ncbi:unnamed protein product [Didymodactylos carnosus]|uniref:FAD-binding domain-containing protein n=1 Tax=Didymodactylos carnosus TaxID=1234261 RepID=A0A814B090_9BILA|nr:unnamed protein product [Didymodactylos carnosus]CAF3701578.1 unnamed protein product [Didymodactylos carnosus]
MASRQNIDGKVGTSESPINNGLFEDVHDIFQQEIDICLLSLKEQGSKRNNADDRDTYQAELNNETNQVNEASEHGLLTVLVVGAGPAGLCMANLLKTYNQHFHVIDAKTDFDNRSKATGVHRNTLKLFDKLDFIEAITQESIELNANSIYSEGQLLKKTVFPQGATNNDKNICIRQQSLERILADNVSIDRGKRLIAFQQNDTHVTATVEETSTKKRQEFQAQYLIACDGATSMVRKELGISFDGETTIGWSFCFDAKATSHSEMNHSEMTMHMNNGYRLVVVPIPINGDSYRFYGNITKQWHDDHINQDGTPKNPSKAHEHLASFVLERSPIVIDSNSITGLSFYHTASRIASKMRDKRVFLIGDAAHIFFPAGGYGLNTAIEDAFALAWRLAMTKTSLFKDALLQTFNEERLKNAQQIKDDSTQKKKDAASLQGQPSASETENETQIYKKSARLENILPIDICESIKSNTRSLAQDRIRISRSAVQEEGISAETGANDLGSDVDQNDWF